MEAFWRLGTQKLYSSHFERWKLYCGKMNIYPVCPTITDGINFLGEMFEHRAGYSSLNTEHLEIIHWYVCL